MIKLSKDARKSVSKILTDTRNTILFKCYGKGSSKNKKNFLP